MHVLHVFHQKICKDPVPCVTVTTQHTLEPHELMAAQNWLLSRRASRSSVHRAVCDFRSPPKDGDGDEGGGAGAVSA